MTLLEKLLKLKEGSGDLYINWGVRCFNGSFDSKTEAVFNRREIALKTLKEVWPELSVTYFPAGSFYMAFNKYKELSNREFSSKEACLLWCIDTAINKLKQEGYANAE